MRPLWRVAHRQEDADRRTEIIRGGSRLVNLIKLAYEFVDGRIQRPWKVSQSLVTGKARLELESPKNGNALAYDYRQPVPICRYEGTM